MDRSVRKENMKHFRELLHDAKSEAERRRIKILLDEELKKQADAGDEPTGERSGPRLRPARWSLFS
jgi:hypothetical protein